MPKSFVEGVFDASDYTKSLGGVLGKFYGIAGKSFGKQGTDYGYLGADQVPKYDVESYFQLNDHFDMKAHFDPEKLADSLLQNAISKAIGGRRS